MEFTRKREAANDFRDSLMKRGIKGYGLLDAREEFWIALIKATLFAWCNGAKLDNLSIALMCLSSTKIGWMNWSPPKTTRWPTASIRERFVCVESLEKSSSTITATSSAPDVSNTISRLQSSPRKRKVKGEPFRSISPLENFTICSPS